MNGANARFWLRQAWWTAARHNAAWWLAAFLPAAVALSAFFACLLLLARHSSWASPPFWIGYGASLLLSAGVAWWRTASRRIRPAAGLTRLDARLKLHNRLTAAAAGVGPYPQPQPVNDGLRWHWPRILTLAGGSGVIVLAAALLPLPRSDAARMPAEQPPAWTETAAWVEALDESGVVEKEAIEKVREQLGELAAQPEDAWYRQGSLEAGDALREQTAESITSLQHNLRAATQALASAEHFDSGKAGSAAREALAQRLDAALEGLQMGNLPLDRELSGQLRKIDPSKIRTLDPRQAKALRERLAKGEKACAACVGTAGGEPMRAGISPGDGGEAGVGRGPGSPPLGRRALPTDLHTESTEALTGADLDQALPGEIVGLDRSAPSPADVPPAATDAPAGAISSNGSGGKAAWRNDLTPSERDMLGRFFK